MRAADQDDAPAAPAPLTALVAAQGHISRAGPTADDVAQALAHQTQRILGGSVVVLTLDGADLRVAGASGPLLAGMERGRLTALAGSFSERCLLDGELVLFRDSLADPRVPDEARAMMPMRSGVLMPLRHGAQSLGVVVLASHEPDSFDQYECDVLTLLTYTGAAGLVAATIQNDLAGERLGLTAASSLTGTGLWRWDALTGVLQWSPQMYEITGVDPSVTPTLQLWDSLLHPDDRRRRDLVSHVGDPREGFTESLRLRAPDGTWRELLAWSRVMADDGVPRCVFGATIDVSSQRVAEREVARLAARDSLTGLANRTMLADLTRRSIATLPPPDRASLPSSHGDAATDLPDELGPLTALLLFDLDRFKLVNDTLGHAVGDSLLVALAERLSAALELSNASDAAPTVARLGGDEFVVLLPWVAGVAAAREVAGWLLDEVRRPIEIDGNQLVCTASVGVSVASHSGRSQSELFREADLAMYRAKGAGRDRIALYDRTLRAEAESRVWAERRLRSAMEQRRLVAVYQPIVRFQDECIVGVEALARLREDDGSLVLPSEFIDVAEDTGLIVDLDRRMLDCGVRQLAQWALEGRSELYLQANVSARTLSTPGFDDYVLLLLQQHEVPAQSLRLELTETSLLPGGSAAQDTMRRLADVGVKTGIDDFGTGYSALSYLQDLPVGFIKVDRSFVWRLDGTARPSAVVRSVIDLAHAYGYQVTAEGVETEQQSELLRGMGCDHAQGWLYGRPGLTLKPTVLSVDSLSSRPQVG